MQGNKFYINTISKKKVKKHEDKSTKKVEKILKRKNRYDILDM